MNCLFRDLPVTAAQFRDDRIFEEAMSGRADALHLAAVFGFARHRPKLRPSRARHGGRRFLPSDLLKWQNAR
jgi:hypothetical protein